MSQLVSHTVVILMMFVSQYGLYSTVLASDKLAYKPSMSETDIMSRAVSDKAYIQLTYLGVPEPSCRQKGKRDGASLSLGRNVCE